MKLQTDLTDTLRTLFSELVKGVPDKEAYVLNRGDQGLLRSLDKLSASDASKKTITGSSIAAHADHLRYGLSLMNRWAAGENPFSDADWSASWRRVAVSDVEWKKLREQLRDEANRWLEALGKPREVTVTELNGMLGSIVHLAYHLGAMRQINSGIRGPAEPHASRSLLRAKNIE